MTRLFLLLFLTLGQSTAFAHAVVTDYSLKIKTIHAQKQDTVELRFNSHIELGLSQFFLVSKGDKHDALTASNGTQQGYVVINLPPLAVGDYALKFKVFAADGHLTEDVIHFSVAP